jgi:hypothetical protein
MVYKSKSKLGESVQLSLIITQHSRDADLIKEFVKYMGCGGIMETKNMPVIRFYVSKFSDITGKITFFDQYPIQGVKSLDYADFRRVAHLMKQGAHLTSDGLEEIRKIKEGMNTKRDNDAPL